MFAPPGEVAEWFKAAVLKTVEVSQPPGVRIPPSPPGDREHETEATWEGAREAEWGRLLSG